MVRDHSLLSSWFPGVVGRKNASAAAPARPVAAIEALEDRRLLSATAVNPGPLLASPTPTPVAAAARGYGVTLNVKAGQAFDDYLGDLVGAKVPAGFVVSASINWGDGTAAGTGKVTKGTTGNLDVSGSHTYAKAGKYTISIAVTATPAPSSSGASAPIILYLGSIQSTADVSSSGGVTLDEKAGVAFTATVGTFSYIAPATGLAASINWGDGTAASVGKITSTGASGATVINYKVTGSHTYAKAGTYPIVITVTQSSGPAGSLAPIKLITTIDSTAIVAASSLDLDGTITGTYSAAPTAASVGALYILTGTGTAGVLGPVSASGRIQLAPLNTSAPVTGSLTLTSISASAAGPGGSVTLTLTGPVEISSGPIPATLGYVITSGTGDFANATGSGTLGVSLGPDIQDFTIVIHSN
jgi:hypothetical protein